MFNCLELIGDYFFHPWLPLKMLEGCLVFIRSCSRVPSIVLIWRGARGVCVMWVKELLALKRLFLEATRRLQHLSNNNFTDAVVYFKKCHVEVLQGEVFR